MSIRGWIASVLLIAMVLVAGGLLALWKISAIQAEAAASAQQPEPAEAVTAATAKPREYRRTTTSIGTVLALRSVTLRNEIPGTVRLVNLTPGTIVEKGVVLVKLDTAVEEAELEALQATAALADTVLARAKSLRQSRSATQEDVDRAMAERDVARAQVARLKAVIARKTILAPFKARVGLADLHPGQFLSEGDTLTTLQGVDEDVHVDFLVNQNVAAGLKVGGSVNVISTTTLKPTQARIIAVDARVDPKTRNAMVRARVENSPSPPSPGASVRVVVPVGPPRQVVGVPASAVRKGATGDHVFLLVPDKDGNIRAQSRQVESGTLVGDEMLIINGLKEGDQVAASGSFKLREGALVHIVPEVDAGKHATNSPSTASK